MGVGFDKGMETRKFTRKKTRSIMAETEIEMEVKVPEVVAEGYQVENMGSSFLRRQEVRSEADEETVIKTPWHEIILAFFIFYGILAALFSAILTAYLDFGPSVSYTFLVVFVLFIMCLAFIVASGHFERSKTLKKERGF